MHENVRSLVLAELRKVKVRRGKEPSVNLILNVAKHVQMPDWLRTTCFTATWAKDIRITFRASGINRKMMKNKQSVQFLKYCDWVANYVTSHTKISYKLAKEKHVEIIGAMKSPRAWSNFSGRVGKRINLDYLKAVTPEDTSIASGTFFF